MIEIREDGAPRRGDRPQDSSLHEDGRAHSLLHIHPETARENLSISFILFQELRDE
jgi:hypothetical protein